MVDSEGFRLLPRVRVLALAFPRKSDRDELNTIADRWHAYVVRATAQLEQAHESLCGLSDLLDEERMERARLQRQLDATAGALARHTGFGVASTDDRLAQPDGVDVDAVRHNRKDGSE